MRWIICFLLCWAPVSALASEYPGLEKGPQAAFVAGQNFANDSTLARYIALNISLTKGEKYHYLPRVSLFLQDMDFKASDSQAVSQQTHARSAAIGLRLGVSLPTKALVLPIQYYAGLGYAETTTQKDPWWGRPEDAVDTTPMIQMNYGMSLHYKSFFVQYMFGVSNLEYLRNAHYLSLGVYL